MGDLETGEGTAGTRTFRGQGRGDMLGVSIFFMSLFSIVWFVVKDRRNSGNCYSGNQETTFSVD